MVFFASTLVVKLRLLVSKTTNNITEHIMENNINKDLNMTTYRIAAGFSR
jgi:hypothetical protein